MDLIIVIVNQRQLRKKIKNHLKNIGHGDFITMNSMGTISMLNRDNRIRTSIDKVFDDKADNVNKSKIIAFINDNEESTPQLIDGIDNIINEQSKIIDTGIVFSIALKSLFSVERRG